MIANKRSVTTSFRKITTLLFLRETIMLVVLFAINNCDVPAQPYKVSSVEVYVSSQAGDRLSKKKNAEFVPDTESSLPVIEVNERKIFQTMEGFGATFNEAGMICLNALSEEDRNNVFRSLFDSSKGAGFTAMKSPIAACDFASAGPWYSYNETPGDTLMTHFSIERDLGANGLLTYIKTALQFGKFQIESPMDFAPDWMYYSLTQEEKHVKPQYYG